MFIARYVHPYSKEYLYKDPEGNLCLRQRPDEVFLKGYDGSFDFVSLGKDITKERDHYDKEYLAKGVRRLTVDMIKGAWFEETVPWYSTLLESLGELSGKTMLLLGNGSSYKELYFLELGAAGIVFTDLSIEAVRRMKKEFSLSELKHKGNSAIEFHAVDAMHLPFPDKTFDIIYGAAFAHHLDNLDGFVSEVRRCLKPSGICRFFDQADSPLWDGLKRTVLRPIQIYSYWKHPRSPEDLRAAQRRNFNKRSIVGLMSRHGFTEAIYVQEWFFLALIYRHYGKIVQWRPEAMQRGRPLFRLMKDLDILLSKRKLIGRNNLMLVWGLNN